MLSKNFFLRAFLAVCAVPLVAGEPNSTTWLTNYVGSSRIVSSAAVGLDSARRCAAPLVPFLKRCEPVITTPWQGMQSIANALRTRHITRDKGLFVSAFGGAAVGLGAARYMGLTMPKATALSLYGLCVAAGIFEKQRQKNNQQQNNANNEPSQQQVAKQVSPYETQFDAAVQNCARELLGQSVFRKLYEHIWYLSQEYLVDDPNKHGGIICFENMLPEELQAYFLPTESLQNGSFNLFEFSYNIDSFKRDEGQRLIDGTTQAVVDVSALSSQPSSKCWKIINDHYQKLVKNRSLVAHIAGSEKYSAGTLFDNQEFNDGQIFLKKFKVQLGQRVLCTPILRMCTMVRENGPQDSDGKRVFDYQALCAACAPQS